MPSKYYYNPENKARGYDAKPKDITLVKNPEITEYHTAPYVGLGRAAIAKDINLATLRILDKISERKYETKQKKLDNLVNSVYNQIAAFSSNEKSMFNQFIADFLEPSKFIQERLTNEIKNQGNDDKYKKDDHFDYASALTMKNKTGEFILPLEFRLNILQWYNFELSRLNREFNENKKPMLLNLFRQRFSDLIDQGIIPEEARGHLARLDKLTITVDDGLLTATIDIAGTYIATYEFQGHINLSPYHSINISPDSPSSYHTLFHELFHAMQGMTKPNDDYDKDNWRENDSSGLERTFGYEQDEDGGLMLNEAMTETLAQMLTYGYKAKAAMLEDGSYQDERKLLYVLVNKGIFKIPFIVFTGAYFEDEDETQQESLRSMLMTAFPWEPDIINKLVTFNRSKQELSDFTNNLSVDRHLKFIEPSEAIKILQKRTDALLKVKELKDLEDLEDFGTFEDPELVFYVPDIFDFVEQGIVDRSFDIFDQFYKIVEEHHKFLPKLIEFYCTKLQQTISNYDQDLNSDKYEQLMDLVEAYPTQESIEAALKHLIMHRSEETHEIIGDSFLRRLEELITTMIEKGKVPTELLSVERVQDFIDTYDVYGNGIIEDLESFYNAVGSIYPPREKQLQLMGSK